MSPVFVIRFIDILTKINFLCLKLTNFFSVHPFWFLNYIKKKLSLQNVSNSYISHDLERNVQQSREYFLCLLSISPHFRKISKLLWKIEHWNCHVTSFIADCHRWYSYQSVENQIWNNRLYQNAMFVQYRNIKTEKRNAIFFLPSDAPHAFD